jgi:hypothetical protein
MIATHYEKALNLVSCRIAGAIEFLAAAKSLQKALEIADRSPDHDTLFVIDDMDAMISLGALRSLLPLVRLFGHRNWAIVLPTPCACSVAQIVIAELNLKNDALACFVSEIKARNWLHEQRTLLPLAGAVAA